MMKLLRFFTPIAIVLLLAVAPGAGPAQAQANVVTFDKDELAIETAAGGRHVFEVEMAVSPDQRSQGLMFRHSMAATAGMLFLFERPEPRAMWMKNTLIPLDMLFIDEGGVIVRIQERTVPFSLQAISSGQDVIAVLELNAGTSSRLSIKPGDRVVHSAFESGS
ncbi:DUF192 domain-containing protein [Pelagibius sp.]|uniref:DUF192 domain-containing protein n=1 Tax=Pelagibius sp. TaxID=1931238 RepID=UPI003B512EAC